MNPFRLDGQVALVTGSSRGIGRAIACAMADAGAAVVVSSRKLKLCEQVVRDIETQGGRALAVACNVSHKDQLERLVERADSTYGRIDILVCNAATNPHYGPMADMSDAAYEKTMAANLRSTFWLSNMVVPRMADRASGSVIVISSIGEKVGSKTIGVYNISKAANSQLVRNLAVEWGARNVRANSIAPGLIKTDMARALWESTTIRQFVEDHTPLERIGTTDDVAAVAVFLASPAAAFVTGQTLVVDGGFTIAELVG